MPAYPPIEDHGLIGDLPTAALVTTDGTIDGSAPGGSMPRASVVPQTWRGGAARATTSIAPS
jgi:hypothetical protein